MSQPEDTATFDWVQRWKQLSPMLEQLEREAEARCPLATVLPQFNGSLRAALERTPAEPWSGLVEQQAIFRRARR